MNGALVQFKNLPMKPKEGFRGFNGIWTRGLCVSAAVHCLLSYEYCYFTREQSNLTSSSWKERNIEWKMWTAEIQWNIVTCSFHLHWLHLYVCQLCTFRLGVWDISCVFTWRGLILRTCQNKCYCLTFVCLFFLARLDKQCDSIHAKLFV